VITMTGRPFLDAGHRFVPSTNASRANRRLLRARLLVQTSAWDLCVSDAVGWPFFRRLVSCGDPARHLRCDL